MDRTDPLSQRGEILIARAPDEPGPQDRQIPAVLAGQAPGNPLLPRLGDGIAVSLVKVGRGFHRRILVEGSPDPAPVVDGKAASEHHAAAAGLRHRPQEPLCPHHRRRELGIFRPGDCGGEVDQHVHALECAVEVASGAQVSGERVHPRSGPAGIVHPRGRPHHRADAVPPREKRADHVASEKTVRPGDQRFHALAPSGLSAATSRFTSRICRALTGSGEEPASAR